MLIRIALAVLALLVSTSGAWAQTDLNVGKNWGEWWPGGYNEDRTTPDIEFSVTTREYVLGYALAFENYNTPDFTADRQIVGSEGGTIPRFVMDRVDDLGQYSFTFFRTVDTRGSPAVWRQTPPTLTQDGAVILREAYNFDSSRNDQIVSGLGSDLYRENQETTSAGIHRREQTWTWEHTDYDDIRFVIHTYTFPTTPYQPDPRVGERGAGPAPEIATRNADGHKQFFISHHWFQSSDNRSPSGGSFITPNPGEGSRTWEAFGVDLGALDEVRYYEDDLTGPIGTAGTEDRAVLLWSHDGDAQDSPGFRSDQDDRGDPAPGPGSRLDAAAQTLIQPGEFLESMAKGWLFLHVDKTPVTDPGSLASLEGNNWLTSADDAESTQPRSARWIDDVSWTSTESTDIDTVYDFFTEANTTRADRIVLTDVDDPTWTGAIQDFVEMRMTWGPWDQIRPGESIRFITAWLVAGPNFDDNISVGSQWLNGQISFSEKEAFLNSAIDSLDGAVASTRTAWANRNTVSDVVSTLTPLSAIPIGIQPVGPLAPDWPDNVTYDSGPGQNEISWDAVSGADAYRIYRMLGFHTRIPTDDFISRNGRHYIGETTGTSFTDTDVVRGTRYYYAVTSVENVGGDERESVFMATRSEALGVSPFAAPITSSSELDKIRVVPNPYQIRGGELSQGGFNFDGQPDKLLFVNLPSRAIVRIFSITGDIINELRHTVGSGDLSWDLMVNDNNQFITPGIYIAHITSEDPSVPGTHIERFVVVR